MWSLAGSIFKCWLFSAPESWQFSAAVQHSALILNAGATFFFPPPLHDFVLPVPPLEP